MQPTTSQETIGDLIAEAKKAAQQLGRAQEVKDEAYRPHTAALNAATRESSGWSICDPT